MDDRINRLNQLPDVPADPDVNALADHLFALAMRLEDPADHYAVTAAMHLLRRASIVGELPTGLSVAEVMGMCFSHSVRLNQMVQERVENHFVEREASTHLHSQGWKPSPSLTLPFPVETDTEEEAPNSEPPTGAG